MASLLKKLSGYRSGISAALLLTFLAAIAGCSAPSGKSGAKKPGQKSHFTDVLQSAFDHGYSSKLDQDHLSFHKLVPGQSADTIMHGNHYTFKVGEILPEADVTGRNMARIEYVCRDSTGQENKGEFTLGEGKRVLLSQGQQVNGVPANQLDFMLLAYTIDKDTVRISVSNPYREAKYRIFVD